MIDILLLTYNNLSSTRQCINHLYRFTNNFQLFILDNRSEEDTIKYLEKIEKQYGNIFIDFQEENYGIIKGRNKCFDFNRKNSESEKIIFLDNDQYVQENWLDSYLEMKDYDLIGIEAWCMRHSDFYPMRKTKIGEKFSYVGAGGLMLKAKLFEELGKFDERYKMVYFEDPDLCFKAYQQGYKVGWNYHRVIEHHHKGKLLSDKNRKYFMSNWKIFKDKWRGKKMPVFKNEGL